jgi:hypothetical protein
MNQVRTSAVGKDGLKQPNRAMVAAWPGRDNPLIDHQHQQVIDNPSPPPILADDQLVYSGL